jgi:alkylation response protein AidB-like acyl-CoA dehydrogenase
MAEALQGGGPPYRAPVPDIVEALAVAGAWELLRLPDFAHLDQATMEQAIAEFGRFAGEVIAPTDAAGDSAGSRLDGSGRVITPPELKEAYRRYVEGGWGSLPFPDRCGGAGFPWAVAVALQEMFASANVALSINPVLTQAGAELLLRWGDDRQRDLYLSRLVPGQWTATMELTEPDAGSDLGALRTSAAPQPDGTWRISGTKIFATWAEHDLADNIVHLVLARADGAPAGTKGLSVFLVPKLLPGTSGERGVPNSLRCARVEEKLGIHASPTCVMEYDNAAGELVGPLQGGLAVMFTMMNAARVSIGAEGPAVGERAWQQAVGYANERLQGRRPSTPPGGRAAIIEHPDVARMLLQARTLVLASRLVVYAASVQGDLARHLAGEPERRQAEACFGMLVPIAKAWATEQGFLASSLALQVHGGIGYLEEARVAQRLRDSRIGPIYEGTNGIHAIDLTVRKVARDGGRAMEALLDDVRATTEALPVPELGPTAEALEEARKALAEATGWVVESQEPKLDDVLAGATAYLQLAGVTLGSWLMAKRALSALTGEAGGAREGAARSGSEAAVGEANFFAVETASDAPALLRRVTAGVGRLAPLGRWRADA